MEDKNLPHGLSRCSRPEVVEFESSYDGSVFTVCAKIPFVRPHKEGDLMGVNFEFTLIAENGKALKSDVCQVAHHGYHSSCSSFYDLVDPEILLWPCSAERHAEFIDKVVASRHLVNEMNVKDIYLLGHGTVALEMPIRPRKEAYLPKGKVLPPIEAKAELTIPKASVAPDIHDPLSSSWDGCKWMPVDGGLSYRPTTEGLADLKAMWKEDYLYLNVRVNRPFHSNPARVSSANCDCVRVAKHYLFRQ